MQGGFYPPMIRDEYYALASLKKNLGPTNESTLCTTVVIAAYFTICPSSCVEDIDNTAYLNYHVLIKDQEYHIDRIARSHEMDTTYNYDKLYDIGLIEVSCAKKFKTID